MRHVFVVNSLHKQIQNEKELIRLASAGVGGLFRIFWGVLAWLYRELAAPTDISVSLPRKNYTKS